MNPCVYFYFYSEDICRVNYDVVNADFSIFGYINNIIFQRSKKLMFVVFDYEESALKCIEYINTVCNRTYRGYPVNCEQALPLRSKRKRSEDSKDDYDSKKRQSFFSVVDMFPSHSLIRQMLNEYWNKHDALTSNERHHEEAQNNETRGEEARCDEKRVEECDS